MKSAETILRVRFPLSHKTQNDQQILTNGMILLFFGLFGLWSGIQILYFVRDHFEIFAQIIARLLVGVPLAFLGFYVIVITTRRIVNRWTVALVALTICGFALLSFGIGLVGNL